MDSSTSRWIPSARRWSISAVTAVNVACTGQVACRRRSARDPGTRVHTIPEPFANVDRGRILHDLRAVFGYLRAVTAAPGNTGVCHACGHRRLAFLVNQQDEAARGAAREQPNLTGVLDSDRTQPA